MNGTAYLTSYGKAGEFGIFYCSQACRLRRSDLVIVESHRGRELARIMCEAGSGHTHLLDGRPSGLLMRRASNKDLELAYHLAKKAKALIDDGRRLASAFHSRMEIFDAEILLDSKSAVIYFFGWEDADWGPLSDALSRSYSLRILAHDLGSQRPDWDQEDFAACGGGSCGSEGCGSCSKGTCASCTSHHAKDTLVTGTPDAGRVSLA
jgi:hypothetical protein